MNPAEMPSHVFSTNPIELTKKGYQNPILLQNQGILQTPPNPNLPPHPIALTRPLAF